VGTLNLGYSAVDKDGSHYQSLTQRDFAKFNSAILGLGDISREGQYIEALAAIFDLEGFTTFCNQIDPHLAVPEYLDRFLTWLFAELMTELKSGEDADKVFMWARLPFFAKFTGDGILFLWNTKYANNVADIGNIVASLLNICNRYKTTFAKEMQRDFTKVPPRLRCGIARGQVITIGDQNDYVGSCINLAARLQKFGGLTYAFPRRGFGKACFTTEAWAMFIALRTAIPGIGDDEIVLVSKKEFAALEQPLREKLGTPTQ
jgi:hypothetical protein